MVKLRNSKQFFKLDGAEPASKEALELNMEFVLQVCATLAPEPTWAPHSVWKVCF